MDTNGIALSDFIYTWVGPFSEDRIAVTTPKGGGWLDYALIESIPLIYQGVGTFHDSIASVKVKNAWGYMGWDGEMRIDCEYDRVSWRFYDDIAWVKRDGKYGYINILGNEIVPCIYSSNTKSFTLGEFGVAGVKMDGLWGGVNKKGEVVIPIRCKTLEDYVEVRDKFYFAGGYKPVKARAIDILYIHRKNALNHFKIYDKISEEYWDY